MFEHTLMFLVILMCNVILRSRTTTEEEEALCVYIIYIHTRVHTYMLLLTYLVERIKEEKCVYIYSKIKILGGTEQRLRGTPAVAIPNEKNGRRLSHLTPFPSDLVSPIHNRLIFNPDSRGKMLVLLPPTQ